MKPAQEFVAEATEILEALGKGVLQLDDRRGEEIHPELVNAVFRSAHTLKGLAALFGEERIAQLAHQAEDALDNLRLGRATLTDALVDCLAESVDAFNALLADSIREAPSPDLTQRADALAARLLKHSTAPVHLERGDGESKGPGGEVLLDQVGLDPGVREVLTEYEEHRLKLSVQKGIPLYVARADLDLSDFDVRLQRLTAMLQGHGEVLSTLPSQTPGQSSGIAFDVLFSSKQDAGALAAAVREAGATLRPLRPAAPPQDERDDRIEGTLRSVAQTVRVDIRRLDTLMNSVGELILVKSNLQRLADVATSGLDAPTFKPWLQELKQQTRALERKLDDLQEGLLEARMVPLGQVFDKLTRLVRRVAREAGKEIEFSATGADVELDKLIVEELSDPLMHLIRNAVDHGIEAPQARASSGKRKKGRISLEAAQRGNQVEVLIRDDGAGIDERRVVEVAVQRGLIAKAQAKDLSAQQVHGLIFLPGFSTAPSVSELSGRGVGLDVVKTNIANLSGLIDVSSTSGEGTTFTITLPTTLAIIRALVVSVSARTYAIPLNSVVEIVAVTSDHLSTVERREVIRFRGQTVPFARLARVFGHPERPPAQQFAVLVGLAQHRVALAVDDLLGQQDIVIKPLGPRLSGVRGFSGATDLGNRKTVLVLDVGALVEESVSPERRADFL